MIDVQFRQPLYEPLTRSLAPQSSPRHFPFDARHRRAASKGIADRVDLQTRPTQQRAKLTSQTTPIGSGPLAGSATQSPPSKAKLNVASLSNNTVAFARSREKNLARHACIMRSSRDSLPHHISLSVRTPAAGKNARNIGALSDLKTPQQRVSYIRRSILS